MWIWAREDSRICHAKNVLWHLNLHYFCLRRDGKTFIRFTFSTIITSERLMCGWNYAASRIWIRSAVSTFALRVAKKTSGMFWIPMKELHCLFSCSSMKTLCFIPPRLIMLLNLKRKQNLAFFPLKLFAMKWNFLHGRGGNDLVSSIKWILSMEGKVTYF